MSKSKSHKERAFTLVELMIVVAIIGVLASVAVPAFVRYLKRSKTAEAMGNLRKIVDGALVYFDTDHILPNGYPAPRSYPPSATAVPASVPCGQKVMVSPAQFNGVGWNDLQFILSEPVFYQYSYLSGGVTDTSTFAATAFGDLDCNLTQSTFRRTGSVIAGTASATTGSLSVINETE